MRRKSVTTAVSPVIVISTGLEWWCDWMCSLWLSPKLLHIIWWLPSHCIQNEGFFLPHMWPPYVEVQTSVAYCYACSCSDVIRIVILGTCRNIIEMHDSSGSLPPSWYFCYLLEIRSTGLDFTFASTAFYPFSLFWDNRYYILLLWRSTQ